MEFFAGPQRSGLPMISTQSNTVYKDVYVLQRLWLSRHRPHETDDWPLTGEDDCSENGSF